MTSRGILPSSMTTSLSFCDIAILACCFSFNSKFTLWLFILGFFLDELSFSCKLSPSLSFHFLRIPLQARIFALYYFSLSSFCCWPEEAEKEANASKFVLKADGENTFVGTHQLPERRSWHSSIKFTLKTIHTFRSSMPFRGRAKTFQLLNLPFQLIMFRLMPIFFVLTRAPAWTLHYCNNFALRIWFSRIKRQYLRIWGRLGQSHIIFCSHGNVINTPCSLRISQRGFLPIDDRRRYTCHHECGGYRHMVIGMRITSMTDNQASRDYYWRRT